MMFNLEVKTPWEMESPRGMDWMVGGGEDLMDIPISTSWMGWIFMDVSQLGV